MKYLSVGALILALTPSVVAAQAFVVLKVTDHKTPSPNTIELTLPSRQTITIASDDIDFDLTRRVTATVGVPQILDAQATLQLIRTTCARTWPANYWLTTGKASVLMRDYCQSSQKRSLDEMANRPGMATGHGAEIREKCARLSPADFQTRNDCEARLIEDLGVFDTSK